MDLEKGRQEHVSRNPLGPVLISPVRRSVPVDADMYEIARLSVRGYDERDMGCTSLSEAGNVHRA